MTTKTRAPRKASVAKSPRTAALKATTPSAFAAALGMDAIAGPKKVRAALRRKGVYISKGGTFKAELIIDTFAPRKV